MNSSLTYLEEKLLHPTRGARFVSARRMRLTQSYAMLGQVISSIVLVAWSLAPVFFPGKFNESNLAFFGAVAAIYMLAITLIQQSANYIDKARSLESSARRIDALRKKVQASIMAGNDSSADEYRRLSGEYTEILEENPINHAPFDLDFSLTKSGTSTWVWKTASLHMRSGLSFFVCIFLVLVLPYLLMPNS